MSGSLLEMRKKAVKSPRDSPDRMIDEAQGDCEYGISTKEGRIQVFCEDFRKLDMGPSPGPPFPPISTKRIRGVKKN